MRKRNSSGSGLLVIVELGGEWPGLMQADASARRVLTQQEGEAPKAFSERVAASLDSLFDPRHQAQHGTLAVTSAWTTRPTRRAAGRQPGPRSMANTSGPFYFTASLRSSGRLRHALSGLASGLFDEWRTRRPGRQRRVRRREPLISACGRRAVSARVA